MNMQASIVIPARLASSRLPGKVLADIAGKPMLQHVWERAAKVPGVQQVLVVTDSHEVVQAVESWGGNAMLTDPGLPSGTARIASIIDRLNSDIIVNLQADQYYLHIQESEYLEPDSRSQNHPSYRTRQ